MRGMVRRAGEGRGEEEMKLHVGEEGRAWTTSGLAWPGGQRRRPAMVRPWARGEEESHGWCFLV